MNPPGPPRWWTHRLDGRGGLPVVARGGGRRRLREVAREPAASEPVSQTGSEIGSEPADSCMHGACTLPAARVCALRASVWRRAPACARGGRGGGGRRRGGLRVEERVELVHAAARARERPVSRGPSARPSSKRGHAMGQVARRGPRPAGQTRLMRSSRRPASMASTERRAANSLSDSGAAPCFAQAQESQAVSSKALSRPSPRASKWPTTSKAWRPRPPEGISNNLIAAERVWW